MLGGCCAYDHCNVDDNGRDDDDEEEMGAGRAAATGESTDKILYWL